MMIDHRYRPEIIISKDETRSIKNAQYEQDRKRVVVTNGSALAVIPVQDCDCDVGGPVQPEAFKNARRDGPKKRPLLIDAPSKQELVVAGVRVARAQETMGKFPEYEQVLPQFDPLSPNTVTIAFNAELLLDLIKTMGCADGGAKYRVELTIDLAQNMGPISVYVNPDTPRGVLMPMRPTQTGVEQHMREIREQLERGAR